MLFGDKGAGGGAPTMKMQMTPMIDIVFLLLVFFMCVTVFNEQDRVPIELPEAEVAKNPETVPQQVKISITRAGHIVISGRRVTPEELTAVLLEARAEGGYDYLPVTIRGDQGVKHKHVVPVLVACSKAGVWDVSIASSRK